MAKLIYVANVSLDGEPPLPHPELTLQSQAQRWPLLIPSS
jgi:hypothetical protein